MKHLLIILLLCLPLMGYAQYDAPGLDPLGGRPMYNPYARLIHGNGPYPNTPSRKEYYHSYTDSVTFPVWMDWDGNYSSSHIYGTGDLVQSTQWFLGLPRLWRMGYTGQGVKVMVIDGGLNNNYIHQDITLAGSFNADYGEPDPLYTSHALQMVGIIGARKNDRGMIGNAYNATMYAANYNYIGPSIEWGLSQGVRVFVLPFDKTPDSYDSYMIQYATNQGCAVIVSSGNNVSTLAPMKPLCAVPGAITVGGLWGGGVQSFIDTFRYRNILSIGGKSLDFAVPASAIGSAFVTAGVDSTAYTLVGGTSQAAAELGGLFAVLMEKYPSKTGTQIATMLKDNSRTISAYGVTTHVPQTGWIGMAVDTAYNNLGSGGVGGDPEPPPIINRIRENGKRKILIRR